MSTLEFRNKTILAEPWHNNFDHLAKEVNNYCKFLVNVFFPGILNKKRKSLIQFISETQEFCQLLKSIDKILEEADKMMKNDVAEVNVLNDKLEEHRLSISPVGDYGIANILSSLQKRLAILNGNQVKYDKLFEKFKNEIRGKNPL